VTEKNLFTHPETHPAVFDFVLLKAFQTDWFEWLSDTLFHEIERVFKSPVSEVNKHKILAVRTIHATDSAWEHWEIFEKVIQALNGVPPMPGVMHPPDVLHLLAGVDILDSLRREEFSPEVGRYAAACFLHDNVHYAPVPCHFAQVFLSMPTYHCLDCDKTGPALPPFEGHCPVCTEMYEQDRLVYMTPNPDRVKEGKGKNIEIKFTYPFEPTKKRLEEFEKMTPDQVADVMREEPEDYQAAALICAQDYMRLRQKQLSEQLKALSPWLSVGEQPS